MYWEAMRTPALPGEYDVTDGSVDYYDTDWENVDNSALEERRETYEKTNFDLAAGDQLAIIIRT